MEHRQPRTSDSVLPALQKISGDDDDDGDNDDDGLNELQCITNVRSA